MNISIKQLPVMTVLATAMALSACGGGGESSAPANDNASSTNSNSNASGNSSDNNSAGNNTKAPSELETNAAVAKNFVDNLVIPAYTSFASKSANLSGTVQSYCDAIGKSNEATELKTAQQSWLSLKNDWQGTVPFIVGPVAANSNSLAKRIYTANEFTSSTIGFIADEVAKRKANENYAPSAGVSFKTRGLDALEYLLYNPEADATKKKDNCNYAVVVAKDVKAGAEAIVAAWSDKKNGRTAFLTNTSSNGVDLVQPFFDNVITVIDKTVKDAGLGEPLALKSGGSCNQNACPDLVENKFSKTTYDSLKANIAGVEKLFTGNGGKGFAEYFAQKKMTSQSSDFSKLMANALTAMDNGKSLYEQASAIDTGKKGGACKTVSSTGTTKDADLKACAAFYHVKQLSDDVKTGAFKVAVNLNLPSAAAGDGD